MKQCERCLKLTDGIHTCTPTDYARNMEKWYTIASGLNYARIAMNEKKIIELLDEIDREMNKLKSRG